MSVLYQSSILKYPLSDSEYKIIDKVWKFLSIFKKRYILLSDFRRYVIKKVREYTIEEFYMYESIINKLFWNLRWMLFPLWYTETIKTEEDYYAYVTGGYGGLTEIPESFLLYKKETYTTEKDLKSKLYNNMVLMDSVYYRTFINKVVMVDRKNKVIISKPQEGSSEIFKKNYFNLLTATILFSRSLYEKVMREPYQARKIRIINKLLDSTYHQLDYGFPNLNFCIYDFGTKKDKMKRIKLMYYAYPLKEQSRAWARLIV